MSASITARMSATSPSLSQRIPIVDRTAPARRLREHRQSATSGNQSTGAHPRLAKPIPDPYRARARFSTSWSCGVGAAWTPYVMKRLYAPGRQRAFVCWRRSRAAAVNAVAIPGVADATMLRTIARRLRGAYRQRSDCGMARGTLTHRDSRLR
jgi:hypothetical protein